MGAGFYLTHLINTNSSLDQWANQFLTPFHTLFKIYWGNKVIHHYRVNNQTGKVEEEPKLGLSVTKIATVTICILCALPGLLVGSCLKSLALRNPEVQKSYSLLKLWVDPQKTPVTGSLLPSQPNELVKNIFQNLGEEDKISFRLVCKSARAFMDHFHLKSTNRNELKGLTKKTNDLSIMNLNADCLEYQLRYHYSSWMLQIFEGFKPILSLPLVHSKQDIIDLTKFEALPNIFRIRSQVSKDCIEEHVIIKYSLTIPSGVTRDRRKNNWGDCILLEPDQKTWIVHDARIAIHDDENRKFVSCLSGHLTYAMINSWHQPVIENRDPKCQEKLKRLIQNQEVSFSFLQDSTIPPPKMILIPNENGGQAESRTIYYSDKDRYRTTSFRLGWREDGMG